MFFFFITVLSLLGRRPIGDWSTTSRGPVPDRSAISCIKSQRGTHEVADQSPISRNQSPISRRPTAKPSCDSSATSAIVLNFGRGEVAEYVWLRLKGSDRPVIQRLLVRVHCPPYFSPTVFACWRTFYSWRHRIRMTEAWQIKKFHTDLRQNVYRRLFYCKSLALRSSISCTKVYQNKRITPFLSKTRKRCGIIYSKLISYLKQLKNNLVKTGSCILHNVSLTFSNLYIYILIYLKADPP